MIINCYVTQKIQCIHGSVKKRIKNSEEFDLKMDPTQTSRCHHSPGMKEWCKTWEDRDTETLNKRGYCFQPNIFKSGDSVKSASEGCRQTSWQLPKFQGNHFRFGSSRAVQEFVIYVRLKRSSDVLKVIKTNYFEICEISDNMLI